MGANDEIRQAPAVVWPGASPEHGGRAVCLWLTGLSGSGKSTIAYAWLQRLREQGVAAQVLDGDVLRAGLNRDLGFTDADRRENVRRTAEVARLLVDAGLTVIVSLISPFRADRDAARTLFTCGEFFEVFVDAPLALCERRDPKGLYAKARRGQIARMTGIDSQYEAPLRPDLRLDTAALDLDGCLQRIADWTESASAAPARPERMAGGPRSRTLLRSAR